MRKKQKISVDIYIAGKKITTQSVYLKVKNGVLDYKVYEMPGTAMKEQDTTAPLLLNKRYFIDLTGETLAGIMVMMQISVSLHGNLLWMVRHLL